MKYFLIYNVARIGLFALCWAILFGIGRVATDKSAPVVFGSLLGAAVISSALSWKVLAGPRERFAQSLQERAERAAARFQEMKNNEDSEDVPRDVS